MILHLDALLPSCTPGLHGPGQESVRSLPPDPDRAVSPHHCPESSCRASRAVLPSNQNFPSRCGCRSVAGRGPSWHRTGVRFPTVRSSLPQSSQRTTATRRPPQATHRIDATASRTRTSSPCRATRAATGTSPLWPQPHRIRRLPPPRRPSRRPSRRSARSSREAAPGCPLPARRSSRDFSRAGFAACFADWRDGRNLPDAILRDERIRLDRPVNSDIRFPSPARCQSLAPAARNAMPSFRAMHSLKPSASMAQFRDVGHRAAWARKQPVQCHKWRAKERASGRFDLSPFWFVRDRLVRPSDFLKSCSARLTMAGRGPECPCNPAISVPNAFRNEIPAFPSEINGHPNRL